MIQTHNVTLIMSHILYFKNGSYTNLKDQVGVTEMVLLPWGLHFQLLKRPIYTNCVNYDNNFIVVHNNINNRLHVNDKINYSVNQTAMNV